MISKLNLMLLTSFYLIVVRFASVLRPLRSVALILQMEPVTVNNLVQRLKEICILEGVEVENRALISLAEMTNCDLRTCINTLQASSSFVFIDLF
jgi:chromosome transmission fidelity protein 18